MQFNLKNDDNIEIHLDASERELIFKALRHYSAYGKDDSYIIEQTPKICEIMNIVEIK